MKLRVILQGFMLLFFMLMCAALCAVEYRPNTIDINNMYWVFGMSAFGMLVNMYGLSRIKE